MEKKLKINFFLKGIAVFAFVAFCLLAILACVTLPFVSNASTIDNAVLSAESDIATASADTDLYISLSQVQANTTYYGISVPNDTANINVTLNSNVRLFTLTPSDSNDTFLLGAVNLYDKNRVEMYIVKNGVSYDYQFLFIADVVSTEFRYQSGFTFSDISSINSIAFDMNILVRTVPFSTDSDIVNLENQIASITAEKNALQLQVNNLTSEKASLQAQLTEKQNQIDTLTAEKASLQSQVDTLTSDKESLQAQLTEKQNQIDTLTAEKASLQAQLTEKQNQIDTLTAEKASLQAQLTEKQNLIDTLTSEKNALQTQVNNLTEENKNLKNSLGFKSRFGYIGDLKNNQMFLNLRSAPIIPDDIYCPYRNDTLVNYNKKGNDYYLSIVDAYDSNNNVVTDSFSGWKFINKKNPDGTSSSFYDFEFFIRDLRIAHIDTVEFVNNCFSTPNYNNIYYLVSTDFLDANYAAYGSDKSQYFYSLRSYLNKDDVRDFFALFDLTYYKPVNDAFYLEGYNNASKGYYDDGYNKGYSDGDNVGYNRGFSAGDSQGYARGVESANTYSFLGLFGAIFDAPIKAIFGGTSTLPAGTTITDSNGNTITLQSTTTVNRAGLLNFNLMGVNLSGFVLALFSISIIVVVIKFALAKK